MKTCCACGATLAVDEFHRESRSPDGRRGVCKRCACARAKGWREKNLDQVRKSQHDRYMANPAPAIERAKRAYYADPEGRRAKIRDWQKRNPGLVLKYGRDLHARNPEYQRARSRRYYEANRERWRDYNATRRGRRGAETGETQARIAELLMEPCTYCGSAENIEADHVVPLARGGSHEPMNLAPACRRCNRSKGAKLVSEWRAS